jgi:TolB protein
MKRWFLLLILIGSLVLACIGPVVGQTAAVFPASDDRSDGAELIYAPSSPESAQNPAFSPDGQTILFTLFHQGYNDGPAGLYVLPWAGGDPTALLNEEGQDSVNLPGSCWNNTTYSITFSSDREDTDEVWTMADDGSDLFRVTRTTDGYSIEPSFSPDGQWIVFETNTGAQGTLWKARADGTDLTQLTDGAHDDRQPNWSPAGDRILFQRRALDSDDWNLYTMATDGGDVQPVTTAPSSDTDASWSPLGNWIVYSSDYGGLPAPNIFIIPAEGGAPIRVTHDDAHEDSAPSWSPDGKWLAFESHTIQDRETPASLWRIAVPSFTYLPVIVNGYIASSSKLSIKRPQALLQTVYFRRRRI